MFNMENTNREKPHGVYKLPTEHYMGRSYNKRIEGNDLELFFDN